MNKRKLIWIVAAWVILTLFNYYYMNFFFLSFELIFLILFLFTVVIVQLIQLVRERKEPKKWRIRYFAVFLILFLLTLCRRETNRVIEKADWMLFYNKRMEIVNQVINKQLNPNVSWNGWICELPFEFPVVSNGGNDIGISRNTENQKTTVTFWVFRNFFDSPSTHFIYTDDPERIRELEKQIQDKPDHNWKLRDNWYRTYGASF